MTDGEFRNKHELTPARKAKMPPAKIKSQSEFKDKTKADAKKGAAKQKKDSWFW